MNRLNNFLILGLVLTCACFLSSTATPNPDPNKGQLRSLPIYDDDEAHLDRELRQADDEPLEDDAKASSVKSGSKTDTSRGRLFLNKFLLFRNLFNGNTQPVIPIIITGAGATGVTSPTTGTATTNPVGTGTVTNANTGNANTANANTANANTGTANTGNANAGRVQADEEGDIPDAPENIDIQALQAALAAGSQEYVVTDQQIKGTPNTKATRPYRLNLQRKGAKKGTVVQVRIPPQYRRYFKNGQKVMLNTRNRQPNRRFVRNRRNNNRRRVNNN